MKQMLLNQLIAGVIWTIRIALTVTLQYLKMKLIAQSALIAVAIWTGRSTTF